MVGTDVFRSPARPRFGLPFKGSVPRANNRLAKVIKAVCRMVGHLLRQFSAGKSRLEFLYEIRLIASGLAGYRLNLSYTSRRGCSGRTRQWS